MKVISWIALVLVVVGGLNRGLVAWFNLDLVALVLWMGIAAKVVYSLVALSAIYVLVEALKKD